ncbi:NACHT domain-containing protein [Streptomyces griseorubiginosus]|uniref:NACHT domain-containing protein n=1 Tax=Streptomyces griseorubiginosus TaxID=67304 RepID=UPI0036306AB3
MRGSDEGRPGYDQKRWSVDTVINAQVHLPLAAGDRSEGKAAHTPDPPPPSDGPEFRKALARLLLRKLTATLDEMHWLDDRLIDLSAVVEDVDGRPPAHRRVLSGRRGRSAVRPLHEVLARPETDLILLQGGAGTGKSVALRRHAMSRLRQIAEGRNITAPLPLYVNLRDLRAGPDEIDTDVLRRYILAQTAPRGSADVAAYLAHCFMDDLRHRRVTLLLDSFDEIPAVLDSPTIDAAVAPYIQTVIELVGGGGRCVVAAREYKGPRASGWTRLQLLGMSPQQQDDLLRGLGLDDDVLAFVQPLLLDPRLGFAGELRNPLSLHLLATYVRDNHALPDRPSALFAEYAASRLRAALPPKGSDETGVRTVLEDFLARFAYRLTSTRGGLSVDEDTYAQEISRVAEGTVTRDLMLRTLAASRILVSSAEESVGRTVFFGHRRVLQYFSGRYVAAHPSAVPARELATSGRWRETAVTVLQDGPREVTLPLLAALGDVLATERDRALAPGADGFEWSPEAVHCLELLSAAYQGRPDWPHEPVRPLVEELVAAAWERGSVSDRKFALDCLPLLSEETRQTYVDRAFAGESGWLRMTVLRECATLPALSGEVRASIRRLLISRLGERRASPAETRALDVDLQRLRGDDDFVGLRRAVDRTRTGVIMLGASGILFKTIAEPPAGFLLLPVALVSGLLIFALPTWFVFRLYQSSRPVSYGNGRSRVHRIAGAIDSDFLDVKSDPMLRVVSTLVLVFSAAGLAGLVRGSEARNIMSAVVAAALFLLLGHAVLWGPSVLYAVHRGRSARELSGARLLFVVPYVLSRRDHPCWEWLRTRKWKWRKFWRNALLAVAALPAFGLTVVLLNKLLGGLTMPPLVRQAMFIAVIGVFAVTVASVIFKALHSIARIVLAEIRRHHTLTRAVERGRAGGPAFLAALFSLREASEATDFVWSVRNVPRGTPLAIDRRLLRQCIARLEGTITDVEQIHGLPAEALPRLTKWQGDSHLLDELGRLDEQLRAR